MVICSISLRTELHQCRSEVELWHLYLLKVSTDESDGHMHQEPPLQDLRGCLYWHPIGILGFGCGSGCTNEASSPLSPGLSLFQESHAEENIGPSFKRYNGTITGGDVGQGWASRRREFWSQRGEGNSFCQMSPTDLTWRAFSFCSPNKAKLPSFW